MTPQAKIVNLTEIRGEGKQLGGKSGTWIGNKIFQERNDLTA
jgi:hypothetical protein